MTINFAFFTIYKERKYHLKAIDYIYKHRYNIAVATITILAVILRLIHLIQNNSFYGDEFSLFMNIKLRNLKELMEGLDNIQASPPAFLAISKLVYEIYKNHSSYILDLNLRIFPFLCGITSVGLFYIFIKQTIDNKFKRMIAFTIFALNTQAIAYSAIFKQYSTELATALILYIISYNIIFLNRYKWYYSVAICSAIWFSYSSIFILIPLCTYIIFKQRNLIMSIIIPLLMSFTLYYEITIKYIMTSSYNDMVNIWNQLEFGYINIFHPARTFIRIGEFFIFGASTPYKIATIICGILIIYSITVFIFSKNSIQKKLFLLTPIILVFTSSVFQKYPIVSRLVLFLYPLISVILADYTYKFRNIYISFICICSIVSALYYTPKLHLPDNKSRNIIEYNKGYLNLTTKEDCVMKF